MLRLFLPAFLFFIILKPCEGKTLIRALARVKDHVITTREVAVHKAVRPFLDDHFLENLKKNTEKQLITEWLLFYEALDFYSQPIEVPEENKIWRKAKKQMLRSGNWKKFKIKDGELREKIKRNLEANRIYQFKKKASILPISSVEIENEYMEDQEKYKSFQKDKAELQIRKDLEQKNIEKQLDNWFNFLEQKYKVRYF